MLINGSKPTADTRGTAIDLPRQVPHLLSTHSLMLGDFSADNLSPPMPVTQGVENGNDPDVEIVQRAIAGGTGPFRFVRGQVREERLGRNSTGLRSFSNFPGAYAPNYRFEFELKLG